MLAVFVNQLMAVSETFIHKHLSHIAPGKTVAVARLKGQGTAMPCPALLLDQWQLGLGVRLASRLGRNSRAMMEQAVERFLRQHKVDAVLGEYLDQFVEFVPLLDRLGIPYVAQAHGIDVSASLLLPGMAQSYGAYQSARAVLTRCELHRQRLISLGLAPARVHVNPGGVDVPNVPPVRPQAAGKRFLAIGRMAPQKAPIMLLEAFRLAAQRDADITLDYIGTGPLFPAVGDFVRVCGLAGRVRLHGVVSDGEKLRLLHECGTFVQHSVTEVYEGNEEGLPAAIQEAMAYGQAVVSTRHSGIIDAVVEGETGQLVDEGDVAAMASAMLEVPAMAAQMGAAGHARACALYTWQGERARLRSHLFTDAAAAG